MNRWFSFLWMSSFCQIACRGVSHTPESVHVDKLAHLGVCDTPLHWLFADIHISFYGAMLCPGYVLCGTDAQESCHAGQSGFSVVQWNWWPCCLLCPPRRYPTGQGRFVWCLPNRVPVLHWWQVRGCVSGARHSIIASFRLFRILWWWAAYRVIPGRCICGQFPAWTASIWCRAAGQS